jgi:nucleotide-binding universal stress UspA family protein
MQMSIQSIICTIDFSPSSPLVIHYGAVMAQRLEAPLHIFHAVHDPQDGVHSTTLFERGGDLTEVTRDARQRIEDLMSNIHLDWEPVVPFGDPVEQLVDFTKSHPGSLVIAASHGVSGFRRLLIGTVVERLSRALPCPLLVVKSGSKEKEKNFDGFNAILVSCDEHGGWHRLAPMLSRLRSEKTFSVHLARSIERPVDMVELDEETAPYDQAQQKLQARLEGTLKNQGQKWFPTADQLSIAVASGVPHEMVLLSAEEMRTDLIVVGARPSGKFGRWISGSTTEALLRRSPCDVLVFPEDLVV